MFGIFDNIGTIGIDNLPPLTVKSSVKKSYAWQKAIMDSFENIGIKQISENMSFNDLYRMVDGKMAHQELSEVIPHLDNMESLLNGVGIPTFIKHYDILGTIVNELVGKFQDFQDKFHVQDVGEIAKNEFLRFKDQEIQKLLTDLFNKETEIRMAEMGLKSDGKQFASQEEQNAYMQELEKQKQQILVPEKLQAKQRSFKTLGVQWGEATLEKDIETLDIKKLRKREFKDYVITGRCYREYKVYHDRYSAKHWDPRTVFDSREIDIDEVHKKQYVGRVHAYTPTEVLREHGHRIPSNIQKKILGGDGNYKDFVLDPFASGSINHAIQNNFNEVRTVPFDGYYDYNFALGIQEYLGVPMGEATYMDDTGTTVTKNRYLPRHMNEPFGQFTALSHLLRSDITNPRKDLCQVTEVYFIAYNMVGYYTYEDSNGVKQTELVTEELLPELISSKGIKTSFKGKLVDKIEEFEKNTINWFWSESLYEGVKISSQNLDTPYYIVEESEVQIEGANKFQRYLPVAGFTGKSPIQKAVPYQAKFNLCMNQVWNLLEKELGIFFLMDIKMIPSEFDEFGDPEDALMNLRQIARDTGFMPLATAQDNGKALSNFNQFSAYDLSQTKQIQQRINTAEYCKAQAYDAIGINGTQNQPSKYETAEGVRIGQEVSVARLSDIFDNFHTYEKSAYNLHLSVAKFAQSTNRDQSLFYTKSDGSLKFLEISDPKLPLRHLGVISTVDSRKRGELERFKGMLLQNNTVGSDILELGRIYLSDSIQELMESAKEERALRQEAEQQRFEREQSLLQQKGEQDKAKEDAKWNQTKYKIDTEAAVDIKVAELNAIGRASDKQSDQSGFKEIQQAANEDYRNKVLQQQKDMFSEKQQLEKQKADAKTNIEKAKIELKIRELDIREKTNNDETYRSTINKN